MRFMFLLLLNGCALIDALGDSKGAPSDGNTGGGDGSNDGAINTWVRRTDMLAPRSNPHVVALDGKIYAITGGNQRTVNEVYLPPPEDRWESRAPIPEARTRAHIFAINGKIYVAGGIGVGANCRSETREYDPGLDQWADRAAMVAELCRGGATTIGSEAFAFGGLGIAQYRPPPIDVWTDLSAQLAETRLFSSVTSIGTTVYVAGGSDAQNTVTLSNLDAYDTVGGNFTPDTPMPSRHQESPAVVAGGKIYVIGGVRDVGKPITNVDIFDPTAHEWTAGPPLPKGIQDAGAAVIDNTIYVIGGGDEIGQIPDVYSLTVE